VLGTEQDSSAGAVVGRAAADVESQSRVHQLLDAVVSVASDLSLPDVLRRIVRSSRDLVGAEYGTLDVFGPGGRPIEFVRSGTGDVGDLPTGKGTMCVPVRVRGVHFGDLHLAGRRGGVEFTDEDQAIVGALAAAAGIAIDNARLFEQTHQLAIESARAQEARERLAVLEDRDRIARDLHDLVVQRLFAVGLGLQSMAKRAGPEIGERVAEFIVELDHTVREVRRSIFSLHELPAGAASLRGELVRLIEEAAATLGFTPKLDLYGPLDSLVPDEVSPDLLAVLREALSNVARHAAAKSVSVEVSVDGGGQRLQLLILDDGRGMPARRHPRSGLTNLAERAARWGGTFEIDSRLDYGVSLRWTVPLARP
jgi:signal transduction histidine kinase